LNYINNTNFLLNVNNIPDHMSITILRSSYMEKNNLFTEKDATVETSIKLK